MSAPDRLSGEIGAALARRERLMDSLGDGLILVRADAASGVNPNFRYLTGIDENGGALLLAPAGARIGFGRRHPGRDYQRGRVARQILLLPAGDEMASRWGESGRATLAAVSPADYGVDAVLGVGELDDLLAGELYRGSTLHVVRASAPGLSGDDPDAAFVARVRKRLFGARVRDATPTVHAMRARKDGLEIERIRRAVAVTAEAVTVAMRVVRPGVAENAIEAEILRVYRAHGGTDAFGTIVASGPNACLAHYRENRRSVGPGELVLLDTGVLLDGYGSDVTRTFPAGGRFTPRQREVYEVVLRAQAEAIATVRAGVTPGEVHAAAWDVVDGAGYGEFFYHGTSHHLGLETHDAGDPFAPLPQGAVITVEPGIYLPGEALGIRIEDDVLVTERGCEVLSSKIPRSAEELEAAVGDRT